MAKEDISNKTVFVLAILVVLVVAGTTWLVLNKLNGVDVSNPQTVVVEKTTEIGPPGSGEVNLAIVEAPKTEGGGE